MLTRIIPCTAVKALTKSWTSKVCPRVITRIKGLDSYRFVSSRPLSADPKAMFDQIDADHDGAISKQEFLKALESMHYGELIQVHEAAKRNLDALGKKLETIEAIEGHMKDLEAMYEEKHDAYNNIGMTTASDIEFLFSKSRSKKDDIKDSLGELRTLVEDARDIMTAVTKKRQGV